MRDIDRVRHRIEDCDRGQVLIIVGLGLVVLLLIAGLVLDYGVWLVDQRTMRNVSDGGAQSGVSELLQKPITAQKRQNAAEHAMEYINQQLGLNLAPAEIAAAATHAFGDTDGFGAEDGLSYQGKDHVVINTPVDASNSCTGASWGDRALNVRVYHESPRFLSGLIFGGDQLVSACSTASIENVGYAVAVLKPNNGVQPNGPNLTMKLAGQDSFVRVCGGDVGINSMFNGGPMPPPTSTNQPAYVKFLNANSSPACTTDENNKMRITVENPSPPTWSITAKQVRSEGGSPAETDDVYLPPIHLQNYIQIPTWGQTAYSALGDALAIAKHLKSTTPGTGSCTPPAGYVDAIAPGKYDLIQTGTGQNRWLCPGVYHFVPTNGTQGLQLGSNSVLAGQGVTMVFETGSNHNRDDSEISIQSGSSLLLNSPAISGTTQMDAPWATGDPRHNVPLTIWVKPDVNCQGTPTLSCSASSVFTMSSGSGLDVKGVIFGPTDNMKIAGNGQHHGAGEIWAWTIDYLGNSTLDQVYEGPDEGYPLIVE